MYTLIMDGQVQGTVDSLDEARAIAEEIAERWGKVVEIYAKLTEAA